MRRRTPRSAGRLCSMPKTPKIPHMSHAHWLRPGARRSIDRAPTDNGAQRHGQPGDGIEVEVVRDWMKEARDREGVEADLHAVGEIPDLGRGSIGREVTPQGIEAADASAQEHQKQAQTREAQIDSMLKIDVVDGGPVAAALIIQGQLITANAGSHDRMLGDISYGGYGVTPPRP